MVLFIFRAAFWLVLIGCIMPPATGTQAPAPARAETFSMATGVTQWCLAHVELCLSGALSMATSAFKTAEAAVDVPHVPLPLRRPSADAPPSAHRGL